MAPMRMDVNISRLLLQCEKMAAADECDNWRFEQYVKALQGQYDTLKASPSAPSTEKMNEFKRRIKHLQSFLPPDPFAVPAEAAGDRAAVAAGAAGSVSPAPAASLLSSPVITASGQDTDVLVELRHRRTGRQQADARAQLLGTQTGKEGAGAGSVEEDLELVMKRHHELQERAADEMLALTRSLKEQSLIAKHVIAKDRETLEQSTTLTDRNTGRLQVESQRLSEFSARACRCWLWLSLLAVCFTFMGMVIFIRLFGKKVLTPPPPAAVPTISAATAAGDSSATYSGDSAATSGQTGSGICSWLGWLLPLCDEDS